MADNDNRNKPVFRGSMKGYNRDDVNKYILALSDRLAQAEEKAAMPSDELHALRQEYVKVCAEKNRIAAENERLAKALAESETTVSKLNKRLESLSDAEERAELYDRISGQLGDILLRAGEQADKIISDAKDDAKRITESAAVERENALEAAKTVLSESAGDAERRLSEAIDAGTAGYAAALQKLKGELDTLTGQLKIAAGETIEGFRGKRDRIIGGMDAIRAVMTGRDVTEKPEETQTETTPLLTEPVPQDSNADDVENPCGGNDNV
ncbi:MAG: hypothetical protein GX628_07570 [Clostridiales bacterium]|nr:hypothetical protein [Clostridiales bacterium]